MEAWKVRLKQPNADGDTTTSIQVVFDASPEISENGSVSYRNIDPIHSPGSILVYSSTSSRTFQISGIKLFSRTGAEATKNYNRVQILRSWRYPVFGSTPENDPVYGRQVIGAPPPVLELSAYAKPSGNSSSGQMANGLIHRVPVVITNIGIDYPTDVDYIPTLAVQDPTLAHIPSGIPVPAVWNISIQLMESHSPTQYQKFSLTDFRRGRLEGF